MGGRPIPAFRERGSAMTATEMQQILFEHQDEGYRAFQARLLPTLHPETVIGVRTPTLHTLAKTLYRENDYSGFMQALPHTYFEENQLHAFLICEMREFDCCVAELNRFLPYVDNWATCDQMSPKIFKRYRERLLEQIKIWLASSEAYTLRFGVGMLMQHFLDEVFKPEYPQMVLQIRAEDYYVKMMIAWYFATALAKQYEAIVPILENKCLVPWVHNKTIQKALESDRVPQERKQYLRTLKL